MPKRLSPEMEHAASDAYKADLAKKQTAPKEPPRERERELTEAQMVGAAMADKLMEYYKQDPDILAAFMNDPGGANGFRDALAEKAGSGASEAAVIEFGADLIEKHFGVGPKDVIVGTLEDEGKKAA